MLDQMSMPVLFIVVIVLLGLVTGGLSWGFGFSERANAQTARLPAPNLRRTHEGPARQDDRLTLP